MTQPHQPQAEEAVSAARVLLIEDELETAEHVASGLGQAGWTVETAHDGQAGLRLAETGAFDVIIVDRMLPQLDGLSLVERLRSARVQTPILFVTAMGSVADRVAGLERGGDDYLVKPYSFAELKARVGALARRAPGPLRERTILQCGDLRLERLGRVVRRGARELSLLPLEFKLLEYFMLNAGQVITRNMLLERVWGFHFDPRTNIVETHISRLRSKIDGPGETPSITTLRGLGYVLGAIDP